MKREDLPAILEDLESGDVAAYHRTLKTFEKRLARGSPVMAQIAFKLVDFAVNRVVSHYELEQTLHRVLKSLRDDDLAPMFVKLLESPHLTTAKRLMSELQEFERIPPEGALQIIIAAMPHVRMQGTVHHFMNRYHNMFTDLQIHALIDSLETAAMRDDLDFWDDFAKLGSRFNSEHWRKMSILLVSMETKHVIEAIAVVFIGNYPKEVRGGLETAFLMYRILLNPEAVPNLRRQSIIALTFLVKSQATVDPWLLAKVSKLCMRELERPEGNWYESDKEHLFELVKEVVFLHQSTEWSKVIFQSILKAMGMTTLRDGSFLNLAGLAFEMSRWVWELPESTQDAPSPARLLDTFSREAFRRFGECRDYEEKRFKSLLKIALVAASDPRFSMLLKDPDSLYWRRLDPILTRALGLRRLGTDQPTVDVKEALQLLEEHGSWIRQLF